MKYVRQFWIILLISAMGEALHVLIPLPVPASVYGLVIMLIALGTHIIDTQFASAVHVSFRALPFLPLKPLALNISCKRSTDVFLSPAFTVSGLNM